MRILGNNGSVQQTVSTGYGEDGRIVSAGFVHGGAQKLFTYSYLSGSHLLQSLVKPNNMTLTLSYEDKRDLLTGMLYKRSNTQVASRSYTYDTLGRPTSRGTMRDGQSVSDSFAYNNRSELTSATVSGESYAYDYDNIGNRETAQEAAETVTAYVTNSLNQYTAIGDFVPTFDDAGNQTLVKTSTGIWAVTYDAENRPTLFSNAESSTTVECSYDYMGRRATKKVTVNGSVTLHQRYIYRGYLQIACCDLTRSAQPALWLLTWDPTQTTATRPLAIQINGTWFTYGWDLTKNICEVYGQHGYIRSSYTYSPYGAVTMSGDLIQPIQWSSEYHDTELALVYYNYRHYNPTDGRWLGRDLIISLGQYVYVSNKPCYMVDIIGLVAPGIEVYPVVTQWNNVSTTRAFQNAEFYEINSFVDALMYYKSKRGGSMPAGEKLINIILDSPGHKDNIEMVKSKIEETLSLKYKRELCTQTDGYWYNPAGKKISFYTSNNALGHCDFYVEPYYVQWTTDIVGYYYNGQYKSIFVSYRGTRTLRFSDNYVFDPVESFIQIGTDLIPGFIAGDGVPYKITGIITDTVSGYFVVNCFDNYC
ncbi:MAG: hypothetical protein IJN29_09965 [Akkermansia sp.]|nr:hypothetical protein [Akkermansia sp.]